MKNICLAVLLSLILVGCQCGEDGHPDAELIHESEKVGCTDYRVMTFIAKTRVKDGYRTMATTNKVCLLSEKPYNINIPVNTDADIDAEEIPTSEVINETEQSLDGPVFGEEAR